MVDLVYKIMFKVCWTLSEKKDKLVKAAII